MCDTGRAGKGPPEAEVRGYHLDGLDGGEPDFSRTELERRFLRLCRRYGLPRPEVNVRIGDYVVDFLWREPWLIVETDSYRYHGRRAAFEYDYRRQARLIAAGFEVLRFTWNQVVYEPNEVVAAVRARLDRPPTQPR
jgi:very-short-patch-repair endonuclease